ncbi:MAG: hypothetical protein KGJ13_03465 [Patescibacteria group bacterium]|nr:hypothetical protein [Patescibacteria group bacterium]
MPSPIQSPLNRLPLAELQERSKRIDRDLDDARRCYQYIMRVLANLGQENNEVKSALATKISRQTN